MKSSSVHYKTCSNSNYTYCNVTKGNRETKMKEKKNLKKKKEHRSKFLTGRYIRLVSQGMQ